MAAEFLIAPDAEKLTAELLVTEDLRNVARLRRRQGYDMQEIIREFDVLAAILDGAALHWLDQYPGTPDPRSVGIVFGRLNRVPLLMGEIAVGTYQEEEADSRSAAAGQLAGFAETLTHQLKTPLGAAEGAALLLEDEEITSDPTKRRRFVALIRRNLSRARTAVEDVHSLAFAQIAESRADRSLPLAAALREVVLEVRPLLEESGMEIEVREPVPDLVVDASRVELVFLNLVTNAAKYADLAKPVRWARISFDRPPGSEEWWVEVADNGLGISAEMQGRIFERFFRAHPDTADGTGLGLAIVREALQQLGSRLELESEPAKGTQFRFLLPGRQKQLSAGEVSGGDAATRESVR